MPNKKITAMPSLAGNQVPTDLVTAVDLSAAPVNQNVKSTLNDLFAVITKNITDRAMRFEAPGSAPAVAAANQGALYHNGSAFWASSNGGAYEQLYTLSAQSAALVFAGPTSGPAATPTFRSLALTDLPQIATASLLGRVSAGTGTPEQITSTAALLTWLQTPTSTNLATAMTDETGTGSLVFATSPTLTTPRVAAIHNTTGNAVLTFDASDNVTIASNKSLISYGASGVTTNVSVGRDALKSNQATGVQNAAVGVQALFSNTTGVNNVAIGYNALNANVGGSSNMAIGTQALLSNTTGLQNVAFGLDALRNSNTGSNNVGIGVNSLFSNTTGFSNFAAGLSALYSNIGGAQNFAAGLQALYSNTSGDNNFAGGTNALYSNTSGIENTAIGNEAGYANGNANANTTGSNNTFIGNGAIGTGATVSNVITLGNSAIATLRCQVTTITALSDERDKKDIAPIDSGLQLINFLRPVRFVWNMRDGGKREIPEMGFIAQDLLQAQELAGITVPNLVSCVNPDRLEASPGTLIPLLVRCIQELSERLSKLENK